jgi:hypothetical protein
MTWAVFFARVVLGLIFFMAGVYKVFQQGPVGHVRQWFLPYSDTFLPIWSLWAVGLAIPFLELLGGALVLVGWHTRSGLVALGCVLATVTFGHLLKEPLYPFPRARHSAPGSSGLCARGATRGRSAFGGGPAPVTQTRIVTRSGDDSLGG